MLLLAYLFFQDLYPWRVKRAVVVNCNRVLHATLTGVRCLFKKKIRDRVSWDQIISDFNGLMQHAGMICNGDIVIITSSAN